MNGFGEGRVTSIDHERGTGVITPDDGKGPLIFSGADTQGGVAEFNKLRQGDRVKFRYTHEATGRRARDVYRVTEQQREV